MRFVKSRLKYLCDYVAGKDVLDLGCVNHSLEMSEDSTWLHGGMKSVAGDIIGIDYEEEAVRELKEKGYNVLCSDASDFDLGRKFDVIVAGELIEHLTNHEKFFDCVRKHLKPGGTVMITTPNALCLTYIIQNLIRGRENDNTDHTCMFTPTTLRTMLDKNGMELTNLVYFPELDSDRKWWPLTIFKWIQLGVAVFRPSFCHFFIAECRLK